MADQPTQQVQTLLDSLADVDTPSLHEVGVEAARAQYAQLAELSEGEPVKGVTDRTIAGTNTDLETDFELDVRIYETTDEPAPLVVYFHGGGFVIGDLDTHDPVCRALANAAESTVVSVDYRLAPEHPFPAAMEDAYAATAWAADAEIGDGRLAVAGDSAGGNLATATTILARDLDGPAIDRQLLAYPAVASSLVHEFDSYEENAEGYMLETETMEWFADKYVQSMVQARNEYAAPLLVDELTGLPDATILTAGFDPLRDEGNRYAERLVAAGVEVAHHEYEGQIHGFLNLLDLVDEATDAVERMAADVRAIE